ncbi:MAG: hypothetical protein AAGD38_09415, partial [Acidobacteriota bacterium]
RPFEDPNELRCQRAMQEEVSIGISVEDIWTLIAIEVWREITLGIEAMNGNDFPAMWTVEP